MKKILCVFALLLAASAANAAPLSQPCYTDPSSPATCIGASPTTPLPVTGSFAPSGIQDINQKNVNGATINVGPGASSTGTQRVTTSTDSTIGTVTTVTSATVIQPTASNLNATVVGTGTFAVQNTAALPSGASIIGQVGIDQTTPGSTNGVVIAPTTAAAAAPSSYSSGSAESNHVIKASAGNVYGIYAYSTVAGLFMVFNSTTVPGDGAVTPIECIPINAGGFGAHDLTIPDQYATGISVAFSTGTNCFNKAASATALFKVRYK